MAFNKLYCRRLLGEERVLLPSKKESQACLTRGGSVQPQRYTGTVIPHMYTYIKHTGSSVHPQRNAVTDGSHRYIYIGHPGASWFCTNLNGTHVQLYLTGTGIFCIQMILYSLNVTQVQIYLTGTGPLGIQVVL